MREIKFRTWDKENKVMYKSFQLSQYMSYNEGAQERLAPSSKQNTVLMQYTGLKDKNGVEIYEGDVVLETGVGTDEWISPIVFENAGFWIKATKAAEKLLHIHDNCKVIGNIYENPELLNA